ncbi:negative regulator of systemic acquired resistance SNI1-like isoform X2 [Salvia splendens]|uniref:negative regulator of systemic acquired resistance SNI1-like isoform X2 n=1 Tax=Salvia splendens TaxID=180675 RepID=UPI001C258625|nr:negative regulator of systemic acquired resistance SNI1-like isoform X2 [Salvia splendens]
MKRRTRIAGDGGNQGLEENTLALLDTSGFNASKVSHHLDDDRLAFLEAVRTTSLKIDDGNAPTRKMLEAIFHILIDADSLDLVIQSYQLLVELDKRFPRLYLSEGEQSDSSSHKVSPFIMVEEAWSPFSFTMDGYDKKRDATNHSRSLVDSSGFHTLIKEIADVAVEMKSEAVDIGFMKKMLLLQYLVTVLEGDFWPRNSTYRENLDWTILRESLLSMLLGSRKIIYKGLIKSSLSVLYNLSQSTVSSEEDSCSDKTQGEELHEVDRAIALALPELEKSTCNVLKKFFIMIMELDSSKRTADQHGLTTRADGVRTPAVEIILDELINDSDVLSSFLKVFDPKWRLEIIVQYFQKYISKNSVQTRSSTGTINTENFDGLLKYLSNSKRTKSIIKKITTEAIQLLLAYGFQAYVMLLHAESQGFSDMMEDVKSNSAVGVCEDLISAFTCLRREDPNTGILCCGKQALITAAATISNLRSI